MAGYIKLVLVLPYCNLLTFWDIRSIEADSSTIRHGPKKGLAVRTECITRVVAIIISRRELIEVFGFDTTLRVTIERTEVALDVSMISTVWRVLTLRVLDRQWEFCQTELMESNDRGVEEPAT